MDYWKSKVLPKVKKVFGKNGVKKAAAAEACKNFDDSKVTSINFMTDFLIAYIHVHVVWHERFF